MAAEGSPMVLFRPLSARERWLRHGPVRGLGAALAIWAGALLVVDAVVDGPASRLFVAARHELSIAQCMEERAGGKALGVTRKSLRKACEASLRSP
jgi:hypothetical protein